MFINLKTDYQLSTLILSCCLMSSETPAGDNHHSPWLENALVILGIICRREKGPLNASITFRLCSHYTG